MEVTGIALAVVPYKDQASSRPDLMSGRVDLTVSGATVKGSVEAGKLNALAVMTANRWSAFPTVPSLKKLGVDADVGAWFSLVAPPGTPPDVLAKLNTAFNLALKSASVVRKMGELHLSPLGKDLSPAQFAAMVEAETALWTPVLRKSAVTLQ